MKNITIFSTFIILSCTVPCFANTDRIDTYRIEYYSEYCTKDIEQSLYHSYSWPYTMKEVAKRNIRACLVNDTISVFQKNTNGALKLLGESQGPDCTPEFIEKNTTNAIFSDEKEHIIKTYACRTKVDFCTHTQIDNQEEQISCVKIADIPRKNI
jgi:hypothetical protein